MGYTLMRTFLGPGTGWAGLGLSGNIRPASAALMLIWSRISAIIGTPLGSLLYHLVLLLAVEAALALAWGEWRRTRRSQAQRWVLAMIGVTIVRVAYVAAALVTTAGWVEPWVLLPPIERFADTASIALLGWAFMPPVQRGVRIWDLVFGSILALTVIVCVVFSILWAQTPQALASSTDYNDTWQAIVWSIWQMGLALLAGFAYVRNRGRGWGYFLTAMAILFVGQVLQLFAPLGVTNIPGWERLANLIAYPLIVVAFYQDIVLGLRMHSLELQDISQASLDQIKSLLFLFEASRQMSSSLDMSTVLENAVQGIARALEADQCAIAFPDESDPGVMRLVAIHNPARQGRGEGVTFPLDYQLAVQQAMRRKKHVISEETDNVQLKVLFALLGSSEVGPLLVQPLLVGEDVLGAIIVGNARSRRPFTSNEAKLCQSMAEQVVGAIQNSRRHQDAQQEIARLNQALADQRRTIGSTEEQVAEWQARLARQQEEMDELRRQWEITREARNALEIKVVSSRAEADAMSGRLSVLETDLAQAHANAQAQIRWHEGELARLQAEWEDANQAAEWAQAVLQGMTAGVIVADAEGVVQEANVAAEILLELDSEDLKGLHLRDVCSDTRWQHAVETAADGEAVRLTTQVGANTLMCDVAPLPDLEAPQGRMIGIIAIMQDVSAESGEQRERLELVSAMAEELRTPMTTIINYVDLLLSGAVGVLEEAQRKFLLRVKAGIERMGLMTDDLAREASGEEQWTSPQRQQVDLGRLIERIVAGASIHLEDKSLSLDLSLAENLPIVMADPDHLRRVFTNLLSNAFIVSPEGGRVQVRALESNGLPPQQNHVVLAGDGFVIVSVEDSGGGLSDEALSRVFDRGRPSRTPQGLGESGAGLALVKTLVEAHGGRVWVESENGVGTTFSFVLPVEKWEDTSTVEPLDVMHEGTGTG
jgi:signal transduction histidine kinase